MQKRWKILQAEKKLPFEAFPSFHPIVTTLLANRGIVDNHEAQAFLNPDFETGIHDPFLFAGMRKTVERVLFALEKGERITVHGDYDADGVTGSAVVIATLRELAQHLNANRDLIDFYIPHRDKEGYGLHLETVELLKERGTNLIITVDCGIACVDEILLAKNYGIDTVVLDHHQFGDELPDGFLIHPRLPGETYPFEHLAAVGVAWKFSCAILSLARERGLEIQIGWEKWLLDLVSIATVTDMVPLKGENRVLLTYGLKVLNKSRRLGIKALVDATGRTMGELDSESIGFTIGPRINAAGRMDHALLALHLMLAEDEKGAIEFTTELEKRNRERQKAVEGMMAYAQAMAEEQKDASALILWNEEWSPALVGLIAGKFMEKTGKPCVGIGKYGGTWIGSGRSPAVYDITSAMRRIGEGLLTRVGGHLQACGFSFKKDEYAPMLVKNLQADAAERLKADDLVPEIMIDAEIALDDLDWDLIEVLKKFEPYGVGNGRPLFVSYDLEIVDVGLVGSQSNHVRCNLRSSSGRSQRFIGFKFGQRAEELKIGNHLDVVYDVGVNEWNGRREIQCKLVDFKQATS